MLYDGRKIEVFPVEGKLRKSITRKLNFKDGLK
jgi:hypothetical protein